MFGVAHANPDGAPWGSADPNAAQNCASCHYDGEPVQDSGSVVFTGLTSRIEPGKLYNMVLIFAKPKGAATGFLAVATQGKFSSPDDPNLEADGAQIRSTSTTRIGDRALWRVQWRAPIEPIKDVTFFVAVNAGNDDQSPLGDQVHFKTVTFQAD